jgi:hypothetical protein
LSSSFARHSASLLRIFSLMAIAYTRFPFPVKWARRQKLQPVGYNGEVKQAVGR